MVSTAFRVQVSIGVPHCSPDRITLLFAQIVRISPATAKYKAPPAEDLPQVQIPPPGVAPHAAATIAVPLPMPAPTKSVSSPIAGSSTGTTSSSNSLSSSGVSSSGSSSSVSAPSLSSGPSTSGSTSTLASTDSNERQQNILTQLAQHAHSASSSKPVSDGPTSITAPFARQDAGTEQARYSLVEESWKHQAQARAILSNLIGPNGEQLTSTDPYNTTVFVGGLSPLISEETLKTFFAPFGDIHYVGFFPCFAPTIILLMFVMCR
jgi:RNA recognition motif-containing protein